MAKIPGVGTSDFDLDSLRKMSALKDGYSWHSNAQSSFLVNLEREECREVHRNLLLFQCMDFLL